MRVKLARLERVGGARPPPLITFTITSKVAVYAPAEWADTQPCFISSKNMYSVTSGTGELRGLSLLVQLYTGAQINLRDLTPYLT
jgi:hypothetical protein